MDAAVETEPLTEVQQAEVQAGFAQGFAENQPTGTPPPATPEPTPEVSAQDSADEDTAKEDTPEPKWAQITEEELAQLRQQATDFKATIEKLQGSVYGKIGGLERVLKQIQESTPSGHALELSEEDFSELKEEYPDLTKLTLVGMNRALKKLKGTAPALDEAKVEELLGKSKEQAKQELREEWSMVSMDDLDEEYRETAKLKDYQGWRETVKLPAFTQWLSQQPTDYQSKIATSWKPREILGAIKQFHQSLEEKAKPGTPDPGEARRQRLRQGAPAKGEGAAAGSAEPSTRESFNAGFKENYSG
jgi:hypothetical protein